MAKSQNDAQLLARQKVIKQAEEAKAKNDGSNDVSGEVTAIAIHRIHTTDADGLALDVAPGDEFPTTEKELARLEKHGAARAATDEELGLKPSGKKGKSGSTDEEVV